jgi:outer membrane lipoprotein-sorting protein
VNGTDSRRVRIPGLQIGPSSQNLSEGTAGTGGPSCRMKWMWAVVPAALCLVHRALAGPAEEAWVSRWLASATNLVTWQAGVTQTRHLKALTQPLVSTGKVWFAAPNSFRWELGDPPQSIALRSGDSLTVLTPRLKRAERVSLGSAAGAPVNDMLALLDAGFPRDPEAFAKRFEVTGVSTNAGVVRLDLMPREASARRMMPALAVELDPAGGGLKATDLTFVDGSRLRNEFSAVVTNTPMSPELFRTNLDAGWKVR